MWSYYTCQKAKVQRPILFQSCTKGEFYVTLQHGETWWNCEFGVENAECKIELHLTEIQLPSKYNLPFGLALVFVVS